MEPKEPVVVLFSGGINSTAAAVRGLDTNDTHLLYVDHGHAAAESETAAVRGMSVALAAKLHIVRTSSIAELSAVVNDANAPASAKSAAPAVSKSAKHVPGLMMTLLGLAVQLARQVNAITITCGASQVVNEMESGFQPGQGDPQLRHTFFHAALTAIEMSTTRKRTIQLDTPFIDFSRPDIIQAGLRLGAPLHLTWSCHLSQQQPCNKCQGCISRKAAFDAVGQEDPAIQPVR